MIKKRAQYEQAALVLIPIVSLLLAFGLLFPSVLHRIFGIKETTYFEKSFIAGDMSTIITALYSSPGNIAVPYNKDTYWFSYEFSKKEAAVFDETSLISIKIRHPIIGNGLGFSDTILNAQFKGDKKTRDSLKEKAKPIFAKINDNLFAENLSTFSRSINEIKCIWRGENFMDRAILIDAGHGGNDEGITEGSINEKDATGSIGLYLYNSLKGNKFFTRGNIGGNVNKQNRKTPSSGQPPKT